MNLRWNTSEYGGVKDLRIPPHRLWKPGKYTLFNILFVFRLFRIFVCACSGDFGGPVGTCT